MGLREKMNENPRLTTGITIGIVVLSLMLIVWQLWPASPIKPLTQAYYTIDDGATYFPDDIEKVAPFQHNGKEAVRAHVMMCGEKGKPFVGWVEKFTPEAKKKLDQLYQQTGGKRPPERFELEETSRLVKRVVDPKMPNFIKWSYEIADRLQTFKCAEAPNTYAREIFPEQ